jgi:hypothetical protein
MPMMFEVMRVKAEVKNALAKKAYGANAEPTLRETRVKGFKVATNTLKNANGLLTTTTRNEWQQRAANSIGATTTFDRQRTLNRERVDSDVARFTHLCGMVVASIVNIDIEAAWNAIDRVRDERGDVDVEQHESILKRWMDLYDKYHANRYGTEGLQFLNPITKTYQVVGHMEPNALAAFTIEAVKLGHKLGLIWKERK